MKTIEIKTHLDADPKTVIEHVGRPQLLRYVTKHMVRFVPIDPPHFPERWLDGSYKARMYWKALIPIGWQVISIETQPVKGDVWSIRDNGHGQMIRTWDHVIEISPEGNGSLYVDRISVDAGLLTPFVAAFARRFYKHRQKRLRRLVSSGFDYSQ